VESGNCVLLDKSENFYEEGVDGVLCIYSGSTCGEKLREPNGNSAGVCAYSSDWIHWEKSACMEAAPSVESQTNHDSAIFRDGETWFVLSGGCTYGGLNQPHGNYTSCTGNAQVWSSPNLVNFTYEKPLSRHGGPGAYWELPYLLPFDRHGRALRNDQMAEASTTALLIGLGAAGANGAWAGTWDKTTRRFEPENTTTTSSAPWPAHQVVDPGEYYSFNPHATDARGRRNTTRRLMYGWVEPSKQPDRPPLQAYSSSAQVQGQVPYWVGAHSLARCVDDSILLSCRPSLNHSNADRAALLYLER
jgi:sucrose-6-phosphate hydrolase SacC (GH32 family)